MSRPNRVRIRPLSEHGTVSQTELFFDLVFVYALTQVTDLLAEDSSSKNLLRAVLLLSVMWWSWVGYSWLGNLAKADEGIIKVSIFAAMGASFIIAICVPEAFEDLPGGLSGPVVIAVAYFAVRLIHLFVFFLVSAGDDQLRGQLLRWTPSIVVSTALLLVASQTSGNAQIFWWMAALAGDYVGTALAGTNWRIRSVSHFAERHGLIVIVALGESIVSIGVGVTHLPISWPIIVASLLGLTVSALLWWAYFDVTARVCEAAMEHAQGDDQIRIARNCYSYLHLPMIAGIIGLSLGLKKVLTYVGDTNHHEFGDALYGIPLYCLYGGVVLFMVAVIAFKFFAVREISVVRVAGTVVIAALTPVAAALPALAALALLTAVLLVTIAVETAMFAERREQIRHADEGHEHSN